MRCVPRGLRGLITAESGLRSVLIECKGINGQDSRNKLFAFIHGNVPSVNSFASAYMYAQTTSLCRYPLLLDSQSDSAEFDN